MEKPHTTSRDFFLWLLTIIALFAGVFALNALLFAYVDIAFPSVLERYTYYSGQIRGSIATLIVMFPIYLGLTWFLRKDVVAHPEKREIGVRKFLIHLTLFAAALTIIIDLITLINTFLNGELTARFVLKVLSVLLTSGAVFAYYLWDLRRAVDKAPSKILAGIASAVVILSIIGGFFLIGSPATQRKYRLDEERLGHLQNIHSQLIQYRSTKGDLPANLQQLENDISFFDLPQDPATNEPYEYRRLSTDSYEICAEFALPTDERGLDAPPYMYGPDRNEDWQHPAGHHCFTRELDPDLLIKTPPEIMPPIPVRF